jgi:hypothetical protein
MFFLEQIADDRGLLLPAMQVDAHYFAVGHSSRCFNFVQDWVEKKVRRHMLRARKRRGFGWTRWSRQWLYETAGAVQRLPGPAQRFAESTPSLIGPITLEAKRAGERSAGKPPAAFDEAGAGNVTMTAGLRASAKALEQPPEPNPNFDALIGP